MHPADTVIELKLDRQFGTTHFDARHAQQTYLSCHVSKFFYSLRDSFTLKVYIAGSFKLIDISKKEKYSAL